jgi:hypothetical protein
MAERGRGTTQIPRNSRRAHRGSERPITWATDSELSSRQYIVTNLYPRILYTFSDVVVFVLHYGNGRWYISPREIGFSLT